MTDISKSSLMSATLELFFRITYTGGTSIHVDDVGLADACKNSTWYLVPSTGLEYQVLVPVTGTKYQLVEVSGCPKMM